MGGVRIIATDLSLNNVCSKLFSSSLIAATVSKALWLTETGLKFCFKKMPKRQTKQLPYILLNAKTLLHNL